MEGAPVVAHVIVGARREPYLAAVLEAIENVCDHVVVNDNSGARERVNIPVLEASRFASAGKLTLLLTSFVDFSAARNQCIEATPAAFQTGWILFVDADEVHGDELAEMVRLAARLPAGIDAIDGYSRHFVGSFAWWRTVERRLCLFRLAPNRRWHGAVHERLAPLKGRVVLPAVWFHYGHVVTPRMEAEKGRLYSSLGQAGAVAGEHELPHLTAASVWNGLMRDALPYRGVHPRAAAPTIARLSREWASTFSDVDALAASQSIADRARNALRSAGYSRLLAWRALEAKIRWGWPAEPAR